MRLSMCIRRSPLFPPNASGKLADGRRGLSSKVAERDPVSWCVVVRRIETNSHFSRCLECFFISLILPS